MLVRVASSAAAAFVVAVEEHRRRGTILSLRTRGPSVRVKFRAARDLVEMLPESAVVMSGVVSELVIPMFK